MTGGTLAWGITFAALCVATGMTIGWPIGHARGLRHAAEDDAEAAYWTPDDDEWNRLADEPARPAPAWPAAPPEAPRGGKHRNPSGPPRHAGLPVAGRLPAPEPDRWTGTITVPAPLPAPVQAPPWDTRPPEPEPEVLEPTAVLSPDSLTDTAWTLRMAEDMDRWIAEHIGATDSTLKAITK